MTTPEQVPVNVADLRALWRIFEDFHDSSALKRLVDAIPEPEPEWEPTDDMRAKGRRALAHGASSIDDVLRAMHREGLIP